MEFKKEKDTSVGTKESSEESEGTTESETDTDTTYSQTETESEETEAESMEQEEQEELSFTRKLIQKVVREMDLFSSSNGEPPEFVLTAGTVNGLEEYLNDYIEELTFLTVEMAAHRTHSKDVSLTNVKRKPKPKSKRPAVTLEDVKLALEIINK